MDGIESELDILLKKYELDRIKSGIDERENLYNKANIVKQNVEEIQKTLSEIDNYINPDTYESTNTLHGVIESLNQIEANTFMLESKLNAIEKQAKIKKNII